MGRSTLKRFETWSKLGYRIRKGSKHVARTKRGECLFSREQVFKPVKRDVSSSSPFSPYYDNRYIDEDWDDDYELFGGMTMDDFH